MKRKIDDNELLKMLSEGKKQKEIAEFFKVSPVAVCKRLKRLLPVPKSLEDLSEKERKFVLEKAKGKTATDAALASYEVSSRESAKVIGSQLMDKEEIKQALEDVMNYHGLTRNYRVRRLKDHTESVDPYISLKALDMSFKLSDEYPRAGKNDGMTPGAFFAMIIEESCKSPTGDLQAEDNTHEGGD